jgi:PAS domain S-box-containing protein
MAFTLKGNATTAPLRALWKWLAPAACPVERKPALEHTLKACGWVTLLAAIPPGIGVAMMGDYRRARIIVFQELCVLAALLLNRLKRLEWAGRVAAGGVLATATLMAAGSADGFHDVALLIFPGALIVAAVLTEFRFYVVFTGLTLVIVTTLAAQRADAAALWCAPAIVIAIATGAGLMTRGAWDRAATCHTAGKRLQFQVDRMPLAYIAWDREFRITEWNRAAERIFGWSAGEASGRHGHLLIPAEIRPRLDGVWGRLLEGDDTSYSLNENIAKDGKRLLCEWFNTPIRDEAGQVTEVLSMVHDITAQRNLEAARTHSEEQLRQVWENSRDGMRLSDPDGRVLRVNAAYCELVGKTREELEGGLFTAIHAAPVQANRLETYRRRVRQRDIASRMERPIELWDGRTIWMDVSNSLIESPQGARVLSIFRDVTTRKLDEARLNEAVLKAEAASRAKSEFLANMSHELRTPMNGVLGMTALALDGPLEGEQREYLEMAQDSARSLLGLLNDILDLSKIEAGRLDIASVDFSPRQVIADLLDSVGLSARQKGIPVHAHIAPQVPAIVNGDPLRLRQVLMNLIGNAIKFTERGSVTVELGCAGAGSEGLHLTGAVIDTGIGVPADRHSQIFDAFAQADGSTTRRFGGTGLGLAICHRLLHLMNGTISVESQPGHGSAFRFTVEVRPAAGIGARPVPQAGNSEPRSLRPLKILLAEDNCVNQMVVVRLLEKSGHTVCVAANGREAVHLFGKEDYDAVLMDVQMPEMDGLEATRLIRQVECESGARRRTPVIALTAHAMAGDREICINAGMDGYLSKPLDRQTLRDTLGGI